VEFRTVAVNCTVLLMATLDAAEVTVTLGAGGSEFPDEEFPEPPPQAICNDDTTSAAAQASPRSVFMRRFTIAISGIPVRFQ
jgi:hypothetical protein